MDVEKPVPDQQAPQPPSGDDVPAWAIEYASAALRCGLKAAEIELHLKSKGIPDALAATIVDRCAAQIMDADQRSKRLASTAMWISRVASLIVAIGYLVWWIAADNFQAMVLGVAHLALVLPLIWFADALGRYTGPIDLSFTTRPTPTVFLAIAGWILLLLPLWGRPLLRLIFQ